MSDITRQIVTAPQQRSTNYCWVEKRIHTGSMMSRFGGLYARCEKNPRKDHLTCWWHRNHEEAAQNLYQSDKGDASHARLGREVQAGLRDPNSLKT